MNRVALAAKCVPAQIIDTIQIPPDFGKPQISIILAQLQAIFRATGKHAIGLAHAAGDKIVDEHPEVGLVAARRPTVLRTSKTGRVDPGKEALCCCFLVAGRAVDLTGEKKPPDGLGLKRGSERTRIEIVVFDRVSRTQNVRMFTAPQRAHELELHVERQRGRDTVRIDLIGREAFRLEEDLVALAFRKAHDLVLDRWAVARTNALDHAGEQRRATKPAADDFVRALIGVRDPARELPRVHRPLAQKREHRRRIVAVLGLQR